MPDSQVVHDQQTNAAAESIRNLVKRHNLRGGATQADVDRFLVDLGQIANQLELQGKPPEDARKHSQLQTRSLAWKAALDAPRVGPPPNIARAKIDVPRAAAQPAAQSASAAAKNDPNANRMGIPVVTSQPTTGQRAAVETTAKQADDTVKQVSQAK